MKLFFQDFFIQTDTIIHNVQDAVFVGQIKYTYYKQCSISIWYESSEKNWNNVLWLDVWNLLVLKQRNLNDHDPINNNLCSGNRVTYLQQNIMVLIQECHRSENMFTNFRAKHTRVKTNIKMIKRFWIISKNTSCFILGSE